MKSDRIDVEGLLSNLPIGLVVMNRELEIEFANKTALDVLGIQYETALKRLVSDPSWVLVDTNGQSLAVEDYPAVKTVATGEITENLEIGVYNPEKNDFSWLLLSSHPEMDLDQNIIGAVISFVDVSSNKELIPFKEVVANANDVVLVTEANPLRDGGPKIVYANQAFFELTGFMPDEVIGQTPRILQGPDTDEETKARIYEHLQRNEGVREEIINYCKDGTPYWIDLNIVPLHDDSGEVTHFAAIERDITEIKARADKLEKMAVTDPLTKVLNRRGFEQRAKNELDEAEERKQISYVVMLDVDFFKLFNDDYGHDVGDEALIQLAKVLKKQLRSDDVLGRLGGEEFAFVLSGLPEETLLEKLEAVRAKVEQHRWKSQNGKQLNLTVSIGVASTSVFPSNLDVLLKQADNALYKAKANGRNRVEHDDKL